jgi:hypothetical protein
MRRPTLPLLPGLRFLLFESSSFVISTTTLNEELGQIDYIFSDKVCVLVCVCVDV